MSLWVIIPVKPLNRAKSRLSSVLSPEQRYELSEIMMRRVLEVTTSIPRVAGTLVISRDNKVLSIARDYGAKTVQESGAPELNQALMRATQVVKAWGAEAVLVLPGDLPFISSDDVLAMIELGQEEHSIVIATDHDGDGTNALLMRPPGLIEYAYGVGSYVRHKALARQVDAKVHTYESEGLLLDVDLPQDLVSYNQMVQTGNYATLPLLTLDNAP